MKKLIAFILAFMLIVVPLCGCDSLAETGREAVEVRYTPAVDKVETNYVYKYDWFSGKYRLMPDTGTVHHDEEYEVRYKITYKDGSTSSEWQTVDKETYEKARDKLPP